jgi:hypothetical protein
MRHHLVVQEVVAGGQHHRAVDQHQVAPVAGLVDLDLLEWRLHLVELAHDPEADRRAGRLEVLVMPGGRRGHRGRAVRGDADCSGPAVGRPTGGHAMSLLGNRLLGMPTGRTASIRRFHGGFDKPGNRGR